MAYLGNSPARSFISFERQVFTIVNSQTVYTLDHSVTNENDIRLVVNNIVQEPGSGKAYTATGTTLTLSAALVNGTDEMYCVFLGRATATNAPGAGSVGTSQLAADAVTNAKVDSSVITGQTAETSIATDDLILLSDTSASGALRKMTRANFVSGIGETNTPAFEAQLSSAQAIANTTYTKVQFDSEVFDSDGTYDNSTNYRFTPAVVGKYFIFAQVCLDDVNDGSFFDIYLVKNGSRTKLSRLYSGVTNKQSSILTFIDNVTSISDYFEIEIYQDTGVSRNLRSDIGSYFGAFRITGA